MSAVLPERDWVYADDLHVGETIDLGEYKVTEDAIIGFAREWDPQWFHLDAEAAADGPYGGLIASGIQTFAIFHRLFMDACDDWANIAGKGVRDLRFLRPVRPGQTLGGTVRIDAVEHEDHRRRALVTIHGELANDEGKPVLAMTSDSYLHQNPARR